MQMRGTKVEITSGNFEGQQGYIADCDFDSNMYFIVYHNGFRNWVHGYHLWVTKSAPIRVFDRCCN